MTPVLLAVLGVADVGFSAFRDAAGRNPRIEKGAYYRRAIVGGTLSGMAMIALSVLAAAALLGRDASDVALREDMLRAGTPMAWIYGVFAATVSAALAAWAMGESELRTLMSVAVLGPLTLARHALIPVGLVAAWLTAERPETCALALFAVLLVGSAERVFGAIRARRGGRLWPGDPEMH